MDFSKITKSCFIGDTPRRDDYYLLRELGVRLIINMRFDRRPASDLYQPPLDFLWLRTFDNPLFPIPLRSLFAESMLLWRQSGRGARCMPTASRRSSSGGGDGRST